MDAAIDNSTAPDSIRARLREALADIDVDRHHLLADAEDRANLIDSIAAIMTAPDDPAERKISRNHFNRLKRLCFHLDSWNVPSATQLAIIRAFDHRDASTVRAMLTKDGRERNDIGLAQRLADRYSADIAHSPELGWFGWCRTHWKAGDAKIVLQSRAKHVAAAVTAEAVALAATYAAWEPDDDTSPDQAKKTRDIQAADLKAAFAFAKTASSAAKISAMCDLVISEPGITSDGDTWDASPAILGTPGGTLELGDTVRLREARRVDQLTRITAIGYQPDAVGSEWNAFLGETLPDPAVRKHFQKLVGSALYGANPDRLLVFLIGPTSTGKSTVLSTIAHVLGDHAGAFELSMLRGKEQEAPRPDLIEALPKRFLHTTEAAERWQLHADEVKRITGGDDQLKARKMRRDEYLSRRPAFTPFIATNNAPTIVAADTALYRRLAVVPFNNTIPVDRERREYGSHLATTEGAAILAWIVRGWELYRAEGLREVPDACVRAAMELRDRLSILDTWLAEETEQAEDYEVTVADLWQAYVAWCTASGVSDKERGHKVSFGKALAGKGYVSGFSGGKEKRARVWHGLRIARTAEPGISVT